MATPTTTTAPPSRDMDAKGTTPRDKSRAAHDLLMAECLENCQHAAILCRSLIPHCLHLGGPHASEDHIRKLLVCAEACEASASLMALKSHFHAEMCGLCAKICLECAEDCERLAGNDEQMKTCARQCRDCADTCERMSASPTH